MLGAEGHATRVNEERPAVVAARDALLLIWIAWIALHATASPSILGPVLVTLAVAWSLLVGVGAGHATRSRLRYYASELERERAEIRDDFEHECEEVRALYAAKGFSEPLLSQIVDTVTSDDDRLLKFMMEEELGLLLDHVQHPVLVGVRNLAASLAAGGALGLPLVWLPSSWTATWMIGGGAMLLAIVALVAGRGAVRGALSFFGVGAALAVVGGGVSLFMAQWLGAAAVSVSSV